jgi:hypothetical protein
MLQWNSAMATIAYAEPLIDATFMYGLIWDKSTHATHSAQNTRAMNTMHIGNGVDTEALNLSRKTPQASHALMLTLEVGKEELHIETIEEWSQKFAGEDGNLHLGVLHLEGAHGMWQHRNVA